LVHGNLTPHNILFRKGTCVIADFGLPALKKFCSLTSGYTTKTHYSSPEQLKERSASPKGSIESDIYSFGIILWELFQGQRAFGNLSILDLCKLIVEEQKRPKINEDIPATI
jgi:serine/threonine protein kinase